MELVRQLQTGSRTAFDQIYERYHVQAYRTAVLLTGNRADAEDVVQDFFIRLWERQEGRALQAETLRPCLVATSDEST